MAACTPPSHPLQAQSSIVSTFNYTLELLRASQDSPGVLSSMLFTISRALRVCKNMPDSDYLLMKLSDGMRALVDHLDAYEDFTGLALVGSELDLVDVEEWVNGPRNNESVELTMLDLGYRLRLANPARSFSPEYEEVPDNRIAAPPNLLELLAEHQRQLQAASVAAGVSQVVGGGAGGGYMPTSPVYVPTHQGAAAAGGGGGMSVQVPIPIPVPMPVLGAPSVAVVTTQGPSDSRVGAASPRRRRAGAPSPDGIMVNVLSAPLHRVESVEHLFMPDDGVQVV